MSTTVDLPDLNVWLALACPDHSHHRQALHYWEQQAAEQVLFCTVTAPALLEAFCQQPGVSIAMQEQGGWDVFHQLLHRCLPGRRGDGQWLAAGEFRS